MLTLETVRQRKGLAFGVPRFEGSPRAPFGEVVGTFGTWVPQPSHGRARGLTSDSPVGGRKLRCSL